MKFLNRQTLTAVAITLIVIAFGVGIGLKASQVNAFYDFLMVTGLSNPPSGNGRVYVDSGTGKVSCLNSSGSSCMPSSAGGGALTQIAQQVLASAVGTVTFSTIPGTYTNLILTVTGRTSDTGSDSVAIDLQFNGDTSADYGYNYLFGNGSAASSGTASGQTSAFAANMTSNGSVSNMPGQINMFIQGYANTTFAKIAMTTSALFNGTISGQQQTLQVNSYWTGTAAITSIALTDGGGGNFNVGSVFTLYGQE